MDARWVLETAATQLLLVSSFQKVSPSFRLSVVSFHDVINDDRILFV